MKNLTTSDLIELMKNWDVEFIAEVLQLTSEDILERFEDRVDERYEAVIGEVEALTEEDDLDELQPSEV